MAKKMFGEMPLGDSHIPVVDTLRITEVRRENGRPLVYFIVDRQPDLALISEGEVLKVLNFKLDGGLLAGRPIVQEEMECVVEGDTLVYRFRRYKRVIGMTVIDLKQVASELKFTYREESTFQFGPPRGAVAP